ncbi:hypothetical protein P8452_46598 [Trifolium repens]|nr:hypothetical protein P8452_46598 [Trifolium repens]
MVVVDNVSNGLKFGYLVCLIQLEIRKESFLQCAAIMEVIYRAIGADRSVVSSDAMDWQGSVCGPGVTFCLYNFSCMGHSEHADKSG